MFSALAALIAFFLRWLTLDGAQSAFVTGVITLGLGGFNSAILLLAFFISSSVLPGEFNRPRRTGQQVWANGFWFIIFLMAWFIWDITLLWIAAAGALSAATADTWATEIGSKSKPKTWLITSLKPVSPGVDGGISVKGTISALAGSIFIGVFAMLLTGFYPLATVLSISVAGFSGCLVDSYLGAAVQQRPIRWTIISGYSFTFTIDNDTVNWISTGVGALGAIIINQLLT